MTPFVEYHDSVPYRTLPGLPGTYPALGVVLRNGPRSIRTPAILDSGSLHTVFERRYAQILGIEEIESGTVISVLTFAGRTRLYQFQLEMSFELAGFGGFFPAPVCFPEGTIHRNILGRVAVFSRLQLGFREHSQSLYVAPEP
jgi:hypothetical protein